MSDGNFGWPLEPQGGAAEDVDLDQDVVALRRLIDYAIDEAVRQGLFNCGRTLCEARMQITPSEEALTDYAACAGPRQVPLLS